MSDRSFGAPSDDDGYDVTGASGPVTDESVRNYAAALRRNGEFEPERFYQFMRKLWSDGKISTETLGVAVAEAKMPHQGARGGGV